MNNIPIFLGSVLVARFKALEAVAFSPFFFSLLNTMFSDI